ncbi:M23 family metallopeptidase [Rhizobium pusense]|uniref:Metalloendopeptidase-like membrane protein n=1 Tax=Agrobacterium genomosp. 2 str. CFBP 5494 TaxID=1183436 RepID=A0A9W5F1P6_9HYPH|nr:MULTISPECIES: M23 family metallopeptidase [Rhizobium/Agrobacterium group]HCJ71322.1 M23 family peptidase [Agrobacterium sp.]MDH0907769.1 M23 family metallopeptidase [Agrobacterium pusense]MDH1094459.1 M23 family metallopeptidase [Agrobacterium pusense]MDH1111616.1 M23 family metallopeptidase [Agrobacterium pusense]MDH2192439.1 M23 family metallopeptidase [Agrobacterium pusense]
MTDTAENRVFGKKREPHVLILARGDKVRHMTIRPWMAALAGCTIGLFSLGYLGATGYLILRDDLIGATMARQTRIQNDYEDRIAALRAQVDRVTSRQLLDQQVVEKKVEKLLQQQAALTSRHGRMSELLERAENSGVATSPTAPSSLSNAMAPEKRADLSGGLSAIEKLMTPRAPQPEQPTANDRRAAYQPEGGETPSDRADRVFSKVTLSLKDIERQQISRIAQLTSDAEDKASAMQDIIRQAGLKIDESGTADMGGPYAEPERGETDPFSLSLTNLDTALNRLDVVRETATTLPFGNPAPGRAITSRFGNRMDPFLGRPALHTGIDFRAETGADVKSTGAGKVTVAENSGGYGNMVEIDHGQGVSTRFGHLSAILVKAGDRVEAGDVIGRAGSTGRSTGPHVHYEVRRNDTPVDPMRFLIAGAELKTYLK